MTRGNSFNPKPVILGRYRHYKGKLYEVIGVAHHSETLEELVIYKALYANKTSALWVRPKEMFLEQVVVEGRAVPRFEYLGEEQAAT